MKLDVHFLGLCAYVPNTVTGGPAATSWSVLLVDLANFTAVPIGPHFAAIVFPFNDFEVHAKGPGGAMVLRDPDLVIGIPGLPKYGVLRLHGSRIEFDLPGAPAFKPNEEPLSDKAEGPQTAAEKGSFLWVPDVEALLPGAGTVEPNSALQLFRPGDGLPKGDNLSAHVVLKKGLLETSALAPLSANEVANIWEFKKIGNGSLVDTHAVTFRTTLRSGALTALRPIKILGPAGNETTLTPKAHVVDGSVSIMNYESEEILGWAEGNNIMSGDPDSDFNLMYWLAGRHMDPERALPFYKKQVGVGGLGSLRRTCGGAHFQGFAVADQALVSAW